MGHICNVSVKEYRNSKCFLNSSLRMDRKCSSLLCPRSNHSGVRHSNIFLTTFWGIHKMSIAGKWLGIAFLKFNVVEVFSQLQIDALFKTFCQDITDLKKLR